MPLLFDCLKQTTPPPIADIEVNESLLNTENASTTISVTLYHSGLSLFSACCRKTAPTKPTAKPTLQAGYRPIGMEDMTEAAEKAKAAKAQQAAIEAVIDNPFKALQDTSTPAPTMDR